LEEEGEWGGKREWKGEEESKGGEDTVHYRFIFIGIHPLFFGE